MNKNRKFEKHMRQFLLDIDQNKEIDFTDEMIRRCVYECDKRQYVYGFFNVGHSLTNKVIFDMSSHLEVSKAGYEFLDKRPDWLAITTAIGSVITAIGVLLQLVLAHWPQG